MREGKCALIQTSLTTLDGDLSPFASSVNICKGQ